MIRPLFAASVIALGVLLAVEGSAQAQAPFFQGSGYSNPYTNANPYNNPFSPLSAPPLSPWLLLGGRTNTATGTVTNNPALQLFLGVIPEQQRRADQATYGAALQNLYQREQTGPADTTNILDIPQLPQTGHTTGYQYYGAYYSFPVRPPTYMPYPAGVR